MSLVPEAHFGVNKVAPRLVIPEPGEQFPMPGESFELPPPDPRELACTTYGGHLTDSERPVFYPRPSCVHPIDRVSKHDPLVFPIGSNVILNVRELSLSFSVPSKR